MLVAHGKKLLMNIWGNSIRFRHSREGGNPGQWIWNWFCSGLDPLLRGDDDTLNPSVSLLPFDSLYERKVHFRVSSWDDLWQFFERQKMSSSLLLWANAVLCKKKIHSFVFYTLHFVLYPKVHLLSTRYQLLEWSTLVSKIRGDFCALRGPR